MMAPNWRTLQNIPEQRLYQARAQLHQAAQLLAATGISFLEARADDSHTALLWDQINDQFLSQPFGPELSCQIALKPSDLSLGVLERGVILEQMPLNGITLSAAASELQQRLEALGLPRDKFTMKKHYELPEYPDRSQTTFDISDQTALQVLSDSYANAYFALLAMARSDERSTELLIWPHHFDLAFLMVVASGEQGQIRQSLGLGMSPGDGSYPAPYYYVTAWPAPLAQDLPGGELKSAGKWHTDNWVGFILTLDRITAQTESAGQARLVHEFLQEGLKLSENFLSD